VNQRSQDNTSWQREIAARLQIGTTDSVGELLSRQAATHGDRVAVSMFEQGTELTYRELDLQVSRLADGFREIGVSPQERVAIFLPNRIEYPVIWLALARLGAVAVPINARYTPQEVKGIVRDTEPSHIVLDGSRTVPEGIPQDRVVWVGEPPGAGGHSWEELIEAGSPDFAPDRPVTSGDLASIQYTSGTTGLPKGCMQSHRFWLMTGFSLAFQEDRPPFRSALGEAPFFYFDGIAWLMAMLSCGGTLYQAERYSSSRFLERVRITGAETAYLPRKWGGPDPADNEHSLEMLTGFVLTPAVVDEVETRFGTTVREAFVMTEIGVCMRVPLANTDREAIGTCGRLVSTYEVKIVGTDGNEVPRGQTGELWVRGPGVIDGYWRRPDANAETFVDGWFRTGDLFLQEPSGYYRMAGRLKEMIKRSGENISAHEVEEVIHQYPGVAAVAVIPVPDDYRDEEVKAIVELRHGVDKAGFDPAAVRAHCERYLAGFKCPRFISIVDDLPYIRDQKVDKMALLEGADLRTGSWDHLTGDWIE